MLSGAGDVRRLLLLNATARGDTLDDGCAMPARPRWLHLHHRTRPPRSRRRSMSRCATNSTSATLTNGQRAYPEDLHLPNRAYLCIARCASTEPEALAQRLQGDEAGYAARGGGPEHARRTRRPGRRPAQVVLPRAAPGGGAVCGRSPRLPTTPRLPPTASPGAASVLVLDEAEGGARLCGALGVGEGVDLLQCSTAARSPTSCSRCRAWWAACRSAAAAPAPPLLDDPRRACLIEALRILHRHASFVLVHASGEQAVSCSVHSPRRADWWSPRRARAAPPTPTTLSRALPPREPARCTWPCMPRAGGRTPPPSSATDARGAATWASALRASRTRRIAGGLQQPLRLRTPRCVRGLPAPGRRHGACWRHARPDAPPT